MVFGQAQRPAIVARQFRQNNNQLGHTTDAMFHHIGQDRNSFFDFQPTSMRKRTIPAKCNPSCSTFLS